MKGLKLFLLKNRRQIGAALFLLSLIFLGYGLSWLGEWADKPEPLSVLVLYCSIALGLYLCLSLFKKVANSPYEAFEDSFETSGMRRIRRTFGWNVRRKLRHDDGNFFPLNAIEVCLPLLQAQAAQADADLRFFILVKLARYYVRDGQPMKGVEALRSALEIRPNSAIANCRLAERAEMKGKADEAIAYYQLAAKDDAAPSKLKDYFADEIARVRTQGPRESGPFDGSGVWWMWV